MSDLLTTAEAAQALRCHERTIRRAIARGEIRATFFGGRYLIPVDALPEMLAPRPLPPIRPRKPAGQFVELAREMTRAS